MNQDVVNKIKKLLELADSTSIHEAQAATAAAMSLMAKYRISEAMLDTEVAEKMDNLPIDRGGRMASWKKILVFSLAKANGVFTYTSRVTETGSRRGQRAAGNTTLRLVGRESDLRTTEYLYAYCVRAIDHLTLRAGAGRGRRWCTDYRQGCVAAISQTLEEAAAKAAQEAKDQAHKNGTSLVRVDAALTKLSTRGADAKRWLMTAKHIRLSAAKRIVVRDTSARDQGIRDGRNIDVGHAPAKLGKGVLALGSGN